MTELEDYLNIVCPYCGKILLKVTNKDKNGDIFCSACQKWVVYKIIKDENNNLISIEYNN